MGIVIEGSCPRCDNDETIQHTFLECDKATNMWKLLGTQIQIGQALEMGDWLMSQAKETSK